MGGGTHVSTTVVSFGGVPYGTTKRVRGVPKWVGAMYVATATWSLFRYVVPGNPDPSSRACFSCRVVVG
eukprot:8407768-Pyramimonas_sp.AAC.1